MPASNQRALPSSGRHPLRGSSWPALRSIALTFGILGAAATYALGQTEQTVGAQKTQNEPISFQGKLVETQKAQAELLSVQAKLVGISSRNQTLAGLEKTLGMAVDAIQSVQKSAATDIVENIETINAGIAAATDEQLFRELRDQPGQIDTRALDSALSKFSDNINRQFEAYENNMSNVERYLSGSQMGDFLSAYANTQKGSELSKYIQKDPSNQPTIKIRLTNPWPRYTLCDVSKRNYVSWVTRISDVPGTVKDVRSRLEICKQYLTTQFEKDMDGIRNSFVGQLRDPLLKTIRILLADLKEEEGQLQSRSNELAKGILEPISKADELLRQRQELARIEIGPENRQVIALVLYVWAFIIVVVVLAVSFIAHKLTASGKEQVNYMMFLELTTVFVLTAAILVLGLGNKIDKEGLAALIGGISGYVLGRMRTSADTRL